MPPNDQGRMLNWITFDNLGIGGIREYSLPILTPQADREFGALSRGIYNGPFQGDY